MDSTYGLEKEVEAAESIYCVSPPIAMPPSSSIRSPQCHELVCGHSDSHIIDPRSLWVDYNDGLVPAGSLSQDIGRNDAWLDGMLGNPRRGGVGDLQKHNPSNIIEFH